MTNELVFYTNPMSRGRVARWMLEEIGTPYRTEFLDYGSTEQGGIKAPDYLAINPMGKVPTIVHGDQVVTEVDAICTYLADAFPEVGLAPPPAERGAYYRWIFFTAGPFEAAIINRALEVDVPDDKKGFVGYGNYADVMDTVEAAVEHALDNGGFIAGETFTAADVCLGSQIGFGMQFGGVEKRPAFERYWERVSDRDAKRRADEIDNAAMPKEGS